MYIYSECHSNTLFTYSRKFITVLNRLVPELEKIWEQEDITLEVHDIYNQIFYPRKKLIVRFFFCSRKTLFFYKILIRRTHTWKNFFCSRKKLFFIKSLLGRHMQY
jgi:hypothetical protein